jgi:sugar phosphate permease
VQILGRPANLPVCPGVPDRSADPFTAGAGGPADNIGKSFRYRLFTQATPENIQLLGFAVMALMFLLIGVIPAVSTTLAPFLILYGVSYFFTEFGPNMTTFIYPAELFPTHVRTTGHGISAGCGKLGAFVGAFLFPDILASHLGLRGAMVISGVVAAAGLLLTGFTLPETRGKSLEELEESAYAPTVLTQEATA